MENGVTCSWAPDGRHFLTATITPRLRVDNAFFVYKYNGLLVHKEPFFMLLGAEWVPAAEGALKHSYCCGPNRTLAESSRARTPHGRYCCWVLVLRHRGV